MVKPEPHVIAQLIATCYAGIRASTASGETMEEFHSERLQNESLDEWCIRKADINAKAIWKRAAK